MLLGVVWVAVRCCDLSGDDHHRERVEYIRGNSDFSSSSSSFVQWREKSTNLPWRVWLGILGEAPSSQRDIERKGLRFSGRLVYIVLYVLYRQKSATNQKKKKKKK